MLVEVDRAPQAHVAVGRRWRPVDEGDGKVCVVVGGGQGAVEGARDFNSNSVVSGGDYKSDVDSESTERANWRRQQLPVDPDGSPVVDAREQKTCDGFRRVDVECRAVPEAS